MVVSLVFLDVAVGCSGSIGDGDSGSTPTPGGGPLAPAPSGSSGAAGSSTPGIDPGLTPTGTPPGMTPGMGPGGSQLPPSAGPVPTPPGLAREGDGNALPQDKAYACDPRQASAGHPRIWRLTSGQWAKTFFGGPSGDALRAGRTPFGGALDARYDNFASAGGMDVPTFQSSLPAAFDWARATLSAGAAAAGCLGDPSPLTTDCLRPFVQATARNAFRRPPAPAEVELYTTRTIQSVAAVGKKDALLAMLAEIFLSPYALFRWELGEGAADAGGRRALSSWELASALSYTLTDGPPDPPLAEAALKDTLQSPAELKAQARRLLGDASTNAVLMRFLREYSYFDEAREAFKDNKHRDAVRKELVGRGIPDKTAGELVSDKGQAAVVEKTATWLKATMASKPFFDKLLAGQVGSTMEPRAGLLTERSFLIRFSEAADNDAVRRGKFITETLLCNAVPAIPIDSVPPLPDLTGKTLRERLAVHTKDPACAACHKFLDGIGLGLEAFDDFGLVRARDLGQPVNSSGVLIGSGDQDGAFDGPVALSQRLAATARARQCFLRQSFRFLAGRNELPADACSLRAAEQAYAASGGDLAELAVALVTSDSFRFRSNGQ
jgi:hypothetical protein